MVAGEYHISKAKLDLPVEEVDALHVHDVNVHLLELEMVAGEEDIQKA